MVYFSKYLDPSNVMFFDEEDKQSVLNKLVDKMSSSPNILDKEAFRKAVFEREEIISTGIGLGVAIPHVKIQEVRDITICIGVSKKGMDWNSIDNQPVHVIFLIAGAAEQHELYLRLLAKIILVLKNKERRDKLILAQQEKDILTLFATL